MKSRLSLIIQGSGKEPSRELTSVCLLLEQPPCPFTGRSNTNVLHGYSPAFILFPLEYRDLFLRLMTTDGEIATHAKAAASADLGGEGTDSWATTAAWLSGWALLNPEQEVTLKNPIIFTFPFN